MNKLIVLTHNDLDALGTVICIESKLKVEKYFYTNYGDLESQTFDLLEYAKLNGVNTLLITDVSFAFKTEILKKICENFEKVILIDHHMIDENEINFKNLKFIHDTMLSASKICYNYLRINDLKIEKLINTIDTYDLWKSKSPLFNAAFIVNEYFFSIKKTNDDILTLAHSILNGENWLDNINDFKDKFLKKTDDELKDLEDKNLIFRNKKLRLTVVFSFNSFNSLLLKEMAEGQEYVIAIYHGIVKFRINADANLTNEFKLSLKRNLAGKEEYGHLNAFTYLNNNIKTNDDVINEVQKICKLIDIQGSNI